MTGALIALFWSIIALMGALCGWAVLKGLGERF